MKYQFTIGAAMLVGACQTTSFMPDQNYAKVERQSVTVQAARIFIYDKPEQQKMMVHPLDRNINAPLLFINSDEVVTRTAAKRYFSEAGRECELNEVARLIEPAVYEFTYDCE
ncbi:hypothetical protein shim_03630 [Shimia sp. SK013]|nr:hypothetical protein shim_03630 [Shimia sp. SK013]